MADEIEVFVRVEREDVLAGRLWSHRRRGAESATFAYAPEYLSRPDVYELDPALPLVAGQQQTPVGRPMFAAFTDCAPDRWGRRLIARAEQRRAQTAGGTSRSFGEIDYLLNVRDDLRQGALRFRNPTTGAYLADETSPVPPLVELPRLLAAAERAEQDEADDDDLAMLIRGGSSLGGARPKAHVNDPTGAPAIAKFPSPTDDWDVIRWEAVAHALARDAGVWVPPFDLHTVAGKQVLVATRFDREGAERERIGYVSAMTMLEAGDRDLRSYLELADAIERQSAAPTEDLHQLWRRIAFSVLVSNTDDHLRNHGFLRRSTAGWSLSPAFDLNPDPRPGAKHLSLTIDFTSTEARLDILLGVADHFRLDKADARRVLAEVSASTSRWREVAESFGLRRQAIEQMAPAFEHQEADAARRAR